MDSGTAGCLEGDARLRIMKIRIPEMDGSAAELNVTDPCDRGNFFSIMSTSELSVHFPFICNMRMYINPTLPSLSCWLNKIEFLRHICWMHDRVKSTFLEKMFIFFFFYEKSYSKYNHNFACSVPSIKDECVTFPSITKTLKILQIVVLLRLNICKIWT